MEENNFVVARTQFTKICGLLLVALLVFGVTTASFETAVAAVDVANPQKWEPLQNPEPDAANNVSYSKLCAVTNDIYGNYQNRTPERDQDAWYNVNGLDICDLAAGTAQIRPVYNPSLEAQGYYTYEADFNVFGPVVWPNDVSDPSFHLMWGKSWDIESVVFQPLSGYQGWGPASHPILGITQSFDLNQCRNHRWGYCQPNEIKWDWVDPYNSQAGKDQEKFRMPILHMPSNSGTWQDFLMTNDGWEWNNSKWWKPHLHTLTHFLTPNGSNIHNAQNLADSIGGDFSLEYDNIQEIRNKKGKFLFRIKRKPGVPANEKPFVGAVYKSWDKNQQWTSATFLSPDARTQTYYEPLRVEEKLEKNSYATGKKIPKHDLQIRFQGDPTDYWKTSEPNKNPNTCVTEDYYLKQYRYKLFNQPNQTNPFGIAGLRDPETNRLSVFEPKHDPYYPNNVWWEATYKGFKVELRGDRIKDTNGVNNWRIKWIPEADTPNDPELKTITIDMKFGERRMELEKSKPTAAHPIITLKDQTGKPMPANYPAVVEITKPDNNKITYDAKTNGQGVLVDTNGNTLATDTTVAGKYIIKVINTGKEKIPLDNCITVDNAYNTYELYVVNSYIEVQKVDGSNNRLQGARFKVYPDKGGKPDLTATPVTTFLPPDGNPESNGKATNGSWISYKPLQLNTSYWLVETQSPPAHQLALPVGFKLTENGVLLLSQKDDQTTVKVTGNTPTPVTDTVRFPTGTKVKPGHVIQLKDIQVGKLPASGGRGLLIATILGMVLVSVSLLVDIPRRKFHKNV